MLGKMGQVPHPGAMLVVHLVLESHPEAVVWIRARAAAESPQEATPLQESPEPRCASLVLDAF